MVTAATGIDAISHALESYVSIKKNTISQTFARQAWGMLFENLPKVLQNPLDINARGGMQLGAHFAGVSIENSMLGICHSCANPLTAHYGIPHGIAIGILLPHVLRFNSNHVGNCYETLVRDIGRSTKVLLIQGIFLLISSLVFSPLLEYQKTFMIAVFLTEFLKC